MGQIPSTLYGNPFNTYVSSKYDCIGNNGDSYYDKLIGGVDCNPVELSKTVIIQYLLSKYDPSTGEGLDCIYNQRPFAGVDDDNYNTEDQLNATNYLQLFTGFLNTLCKKQTSISKIIINTIPMGIEPFTLASDGTVEYSTNGTTYSTTPLEITGGETIYLRAAGGDCAQCGESAYELYLDTVPEGETPLDLEDWLDSLVGEPGPTGPAGTNANIAGLTWRGTWTASPSPAYAVNDAVQSQGSSYVLVNTSLGSASTDPATDTSGRWDELALAGMTGPAGTAGAPGTNGAFGVGGFRTLNASTTNWILLATHPLGTASLTPINPQTPIDQTITTLTNDAGVVITFAATAACTLRLPNSLPNFPVGYQVTVMQLGTGQLSVSPVTGGLATISSANSMRHLRTQFSAATLIKASAGNGTTTYDSWYLFGDITNVVI
jgi:hypothetical protein